MSAVNALAQIFCDRFVFCLDIFNSRESDLMHQALPVQVRQYLLRVRQSLNDKVSRLVCMMRSEIEKRKILSISPCSRTIVFLFNFHFVIRVFWILLLTAGAYSS